MRIFCCFAMLLMLSACGKKEKSDPASPTTAAPEEKRMMEEKSADKDVRDPEPMVTPPVTGEETKPTEEPPMDTRDATPADQPSQPGNVKAEPGHDAMKDVGMAPSPPRISSMSLLDDLGGKGAGGSIGGTGGTGGGVKADEDLRQRPKRDSQPDTKATGYHDKEQDEPTQE